MRLSNTEDEERPPGLDCYCHNSGDHLRIRPKSNSLLFWVDLYGDIM